MARKVRKVSFLRLCAQARQAIGCPTSYNIQGVVTSKTSRPAARDDLLHSGLGHLTVAHTLAIPPRLAAFVVIANCTLRLGSRGCCLWMASTANIAHTDAIPQPMPLTSNAVLIMGHGIEAVEHLLDVPGRLRTRRIVLAQIRGEASRSKIDTLRLPFKPVSLGLLRVAGTCASWTHMSHNNLPLACCACRFARHLPATCLPFVSLCQTVDS